MLDPDARFCAECGTAVPEPTATNATATATATATPAATPATSDGWFSDSRHRWFAVAAAALVIVIVVIVASSGGGNKKVTAAPHKRSRHVTTTTEETTTTTTLPGSGTAHTWTMDASDDQGYSASVVIGLDDPIKPSEVRASSVGRRLVACTADPNTDAIVPAHMAETNTTSKFPVILGLRLQFDNSADVGNLSIASDQKFTTDTACKSSTDSSSDYGLVDIYGVQWNDALDPLQTNQDEFYFVIHNYYSPAMPQGDVADYQAMSIQPVITFGDTNGSDSRTVPTGGTPSGSGPSPTFGLIVG